MTVKTILVGGKRYKRIEKGAKTDTRCANEDESLPSSKYHYNKRK